MSSKRINQYIAALGLLTTFAANALGPEDQEFIGKTGDQLVTLRFNADPNVYTAGTSELASCRYEGDRVACGHGDGKGAQLIYLRGDRSSNQFMVARTLYRKLYPKNKIGKWNSEGVYSDNFFVCSTGCSSAVPKLFILVTHGD